MKKRIHFYKQRDRNDCGPTCLKIIARYHGKNLNILKLRKICGITSTGVTFLDLYDAANELGLEAVALKLSINELTKVNLPCILHWRQNHFVVLYKIKNNAFYISDPAVGNIKLTTEELKMNWIFQDFSDKGNALLLEPTKKFFEIMDDEIPKLSWKFVTEYLFTYKKLLAQIVLALGISTIFQLLTPFLTQWIVDTGIALKDISFIQAILIAQLAIFVGATSADFLRSWILLHISTRVNIAILTDLLIKIMKLPISFFDSKTTGDIVQRISDVKRIERFLTGSALSVFFSILNFLVFAILIAFYNINIFLVFSFFTILYVFWIKSFLKKRKALNYVEFSNGTDNQNYLIELIEGMKEIKLNNAETVYFSKSIHPVSFQTVQPEEGFFFLGPFHPEENLAAQIQNRQFPSGSFCSAKGQDHLNFNITLQ